MRAKNVFRRVACTAVLVIVAMAGVACGREQGSLTAPANPMPSLSRASSPRIYTWAATCSVSIGYAEFSWHWQLADGSTVVGGVYDCVPASGTGTIPLTAIAIEVDGDIFGDLAGCEDYKTVTRSISASGNVSIDMDLSLPSSTGTAGYTSPCPAGRASLTIGSK